MALIKCSECSNEISDKAENCPHCGAPKMAENDKIQDKIDSAQREYEENEKKKIEIDNSKSKKPNTTNIFKRFFNLEKKQIYLICFILWPLTCAFGITLNDYIREITYGDVNQFGKIPYFSVMTGITAGLFAGVILLGLSYFINLLLFIFIRSSKLFRLDMPFFDDVAAAPLTTPKTFFVITLLWTAFTIYGYSGTFIDVLNAKKENVEHLNKRIKEFNRNN